MPSSQWTQAEKGATTVKIAGGSDMQQVTVSVPGTLSGKLLLFQILYEARQNDATHSLNSQKDLTTDTLPITVLHNSETCIHCVKNIILPYVSATH